MNKQISFQVTDNLQLTERIVTYFTKSGFKFIDSLDDKLKFIHNSSLLDTWTIDPLKWGSEIIISFNDKEVTADFYVDTDSQMNTVEEEKVWNTFIENFKLSLTDEKQWTDINKMVLSDVKKSR